MYKDGSRNDDIEICIKVLFYIGNRFVPYYCCVPTIVNNNTPLWKYLRV